MAPIRRYLRITKFSVLECRIYLDNPALAQSWLLHPRDPVLPRVVEAVRPLVLPKLREEQERERSRKKSKKRSIKDVVVEDDFEVSIFLMETNTRHSLLYKRKHFRDKTQTKLTSNSSKLVGASRDAPVDVDAVTAAAEEMLRVPDDDNDDAANNGGSLSAIPPNLRRESEEDDDEPVLLSDIPVAAQPAPEEEEEDEPATRRRSKRRRRRGPSQRGDDNDDDEEIADSIPGTDASSSGNDDLFVSDGDGDGDDSEDHPAGLEAAETAALGIGDGIGGPSDDKKKLTMDISYEGFAIYGRVLCLVVKRRNPPGPGRGSGPAGVARPSGGAAQSRSQSQVQSQSGPPGGQAVMENWITSTQIPPEAVEEEPEAP